MQWDEYEELRSANSQHAVTVITGKYTNPARIRIQKPPPNPVVTDVFHAAATVQEYCQHPLPIIDHLLVLLCLRRVRSVICHCMLFRDWGDYQSRVQPCQRISQRCEFGVSPANLQILRLSARSLKNGRNTYACPDGICNILCAIRAFPSFRNQDG